MSKLDYGTTPIKKLVLQLAIPSIITMIVGSINIVIDGIFMGNFIGSDALAAVNLVMPIAIIAFSLVDMIGIGSSVKIGILLGEGKKKEASRIFSASCVLILLLSFVITAIGLVFAHSIVYTFIEDKNLAQLAYDYVRIYVIGFPLIAPLYALDNYLVICGKVNKSMYVNIIVSVVNIALNTVFIGILGLGITYAAIASVVGMGVGSIIFVCSFFGNKLSIKFTKPKVDINDMGKILHNGSSEFLSLTSGSIISILVNAIMMDFSGPNGVAAISIIFYIRMLLNPVIVGIIVSAQPIISYNFGAKNYPRIREIFTFVSLIAGAISIISVAIMVIFPDFLISLFSTEKDIEMREIAGVGILLCAPSYLFAWFNSLVSTFLTSFEKARESVRLTLLGSVIFPIASYIILSGELEAYGVFLAQSVGAFATFLVAFNMFKKEYSRIKNN